MFYLEDGKLIELRDNIPRSLHLYKKNEPWLNDLLNIEIDINDSLIVSSSDNRSADDLKNAITLHEHYKGLPYSLASDQNFWSLLTHTQFWPYMRQRWPIEKAQGDPVKYIQTRYFFGEKGFYRNGLSRLWWYAHLTYDDSLSNPYFYTNLALDKQDLAGQIIENKYVARNKVALRAIFKTLEHVQELEESDKIEVVLDKRSLIRDLMKYVNLVGGVSIWDLFSEDEAFQKLKKRIEFHIDRGLIKRIKVSI